jgi:hypothetical protein
MTSLLSADHTLLSFTMFLLLPVETVGNKDLSTLSLPCVIFLHKFSLFSVGMDDLSVLSWLSCFTGSLWRLLVTTTYPLSSDPVLLIYTMFLFLSVVALNNDDLSALKWPSVIIQHNVSFSLSRGYGLWWPLDDLFVLSWPRVFIVHNVSLTLFGGCRWWQPVCSQLTLCYYSTSYFLFSLWWLWVLTTSLFSDDHVLLFNTMFLLLSVEVVGNDDPSTLSGPRVIILHLSSHTLCAGCE